MAYVLLNFGIVEGVCTGQVYSKLIYNFFCIFVLVCLPEKMTGRGY